MSVRLVRYLAQCGLASRRNAADLVRAGVVEVNGAVVDNMALAIGPEDQVRVSGKPVRPAEKTSALILNKPPGTVTSRSDPHNDRTVFEHVPAELRSRVNPVGRLDKETTGLLLFTDDGDLAFRLAHPRYEIAKTYRVIVEGRIDDEAIEMLEEGVVLDDGPTARAKVRLVEREPERSEFEITIHEGRNRQVRRMCEALEFRVKKLHRIGYGPLVLGRLRRGESRPLTALEERTLRNVVGLPTESPKARNQGPDKNRKKGQGGSRPGASARPATGRGASRKPGARNPRKPQGRPKS